MRFLPTLFRKSIIKGQLTLISPDGSSEVFGTKDDSAPVVIRINDKSLDWKIPFNPELKAAEAYMDGTLEILEGDVYDFLLLFYRNRRQFDRSPGQIFWGTLSRKLRRLQQHNPVTQSRAHVKHHYDLKDELFDLFLDESKQYSCAYFPTGKETLEQAQIEKKNHIIKKLNIKPGQTVLDIGCGWGGLAIEIAERYDVQVKGITLSENQARIARQNASDAGLSARVSFDICDYRHLTEKFDRVVSVGMLEHVGAYHLKEYFRTVRNLLGPDGVALIHSISTKSPPGITGPFIRKYIFPNGYSPAMSEIVSAVELSGLWVLDVEVLRHHYGHTLHEWRNRFAAQRDEAVAMYDERFARMWEFYLAACEGVFMHGSANVVQIQLGREADGVPLTRGYLYKNTKKK